MLIIVNNISLRCPNDYEISMALVQIRKFQLILAAILYYQDGRIFY